VRYIIADVAVHTASRDLAAVADGLERLSMWLRRRSPAQVSTTVVTTLDTLASEGPLRVSDLAQREALTQPGMTSLVNRLEAAGHAERLADPADGRVALVRITDAGRELLAERHAARASTLAAALDSLDDTERGALVAALPAIQHLITSDRKPN
jgi:DNA-binding MarR family transcriptional regulator